MGVGVQHHAPAALSHRKTRYPLYRRLGGPQGRSGRVRKNSPPTGIRSPDCPARSESLYRLSYPGRVISLHPTLTIILFVRKMRKTVTLRLLWWIMTAGSVGYWEERQRWSCPCTRHIDIVPQILVDVTYRLLVSLTPHLLYPRGKCPIYPLSKRLCGLQREPGCFGDKSTCLWQYSNLEYSSPNCRRLVHTC